MFRCSDVQGLYIISIVADPSLTRGFGPEEWLARPGRGRFNLTVYHAQVPIHECTNADAPMHKMHQCTNAPMCQCSITNALLH